MIKIITDTASDITLTQANQMNVILLPLAVSFGEKQYYQLEDEDFTIFYKMHEESEILPVTSQITPGQYAEHFKEAKKNNDSVVVITISSILSGTIQSAFIAKEMADCDNIHIIDSHNALIGQRLLVEYAVRLRDEGANVEEIVAKVTEVSKRIRLIGALDTLKYLIKGGRISKGAGMIGGLLNVKPIISIKNGEVNAEGKARGFDGAIKKMLGHIEKENNFDPDFPFCFGYTKVKGKLDVLTEAVKENFGVENIKTYPVGGVIGTHAGPNAIVAVWVVKK